MIYPLFSLDASFLFAGFGLGFFFGNLVSLIKFIITTVSNWMRK